MRKNTLFKGILFFVLNLFFTNLFAWDHSVEFGYGYSHDPNNVKYNNSGFLLSGDLYPIKRTPLTFWSFTGSLGQWHTTAPIYKNLTTVAASLALRLYPFHQFHLQNNSPYFLGSLGPAYLSSNKFGINTQAYHVALQTNLGVGDEINHFDVNLRLQHFSNAGTGTPNQGFNILYLLSLGYLF